MQKRFNWYRTGTLQEHYSLHFLEKGSLENEAQLAKIFKKS